MKGVRQKIREIKEIREDREKILSERGDLLQTIQRLKELREDHDKSQTEIGILLKTTQQQYYKYEKGIQELPTRHLVTLAKYYGTSADYILGLTNIIKPYPRG